MTAAEKTLDNKLSEMLEDKFLGKVELHPLSDKKSEQNVINTTTKEVPTVILENAKLVNNFHCVQEDSFSPENSVNLAALMITEPDVFFKDTVNCILNPLHKSNVQVTPIIDRNFSKLSEKYEILEEIEKAVVQQINSGSMIYDIQSISDEFITNAIFHSTSIIAQRKDHMLGSDLGNIKLAISNDELLILCTDPHGKLKPMNLFSRIHTCYTSEIADKINMGQGGAGIGSFLVHGMSASYIVAVQENIQTIVSSVLPLKMGNRKRTKLSKNLHSLYVEEKHNG